MNVSIVTPTWNRSATLQRTIESVESQTLRPFRHVIVDNLSEDFTSHLVGEYQARAPFEVVHLRERDRGIYDAMNKGVQAAAGDALYFLNDDDLLLASDSLQCLARALSLAPSGIAFGDVVVCDPGRGTSKIRNHRQVNRLTLAEKSICQQATLYSREAMKLVGPFDAGLRAAGDYDWMIRALVRHGLPAVYLRQTVAVFTAGGISSDPAHAVDFRAEMNAVADRYFPPAVRERALRYRRFWRKIPWGLRFCPGAETGDRLNVDSTIAWRNKLLPDPMAFFDF
jgi:glycosyltransferase